MKNLDFIIKQAYRLGLRSYFITSENSFWNLYEILFFSFFIKLFVDTRIFYEHCKDTDKELLASSKDGTLDGQFTDIYSLKSEFRQMLRSVSFLVFLSVLKIFKFMSLSDSLNFMYKVVLRAKGEIAGFMVVYLVLIACSALLATTLFGYEIRDFHNFASSIMSLIRLSVGILDFDYTQMKEADAFFAPVFLVGFVFVSMLTAINMFIAILSEYYTIVKDESTQLKDDIAIFESQGMTVPTESVFGNIGEIWSGLKLTSELMVQTDPPHLPAMLQPVRRIVGPSWGYPQSVGESGGLVCHPNVHPNASNLVRIHLYSEFVPTELEHCRGKARANIPILGEVSERRGFRSHCVGLGDNKSPINELCAAYGKLFHEGSWICGNPRCKHRYDPDMDGDGLTMEELHGSKRAGTWRCPKCNLSKSNKVDPNQPDRVHTNECFSYHREDTGTRTVCCLKMSEIHSEFRPQVLLKLRPRFTTVINPTDGSLDPDFENQCENPDTVDLMEDTFGAQIKLELLIHEEMKEDIVYGEKCIGKARDVFALFRVAELSSWEHFSGEPTKLNKQVRLIYMQAIDGSD